jgi:hypothetical protein
MADKPSYIGLLNAIAIAEGHANKYLAAWADATPNSALESVLRVIALREGEHALAFEKRLCELGYSLMERPDPGPGNEVIGKAGKDLASKMRFFGSDAGDLEKLEYLGYTTPGQCPPDPFCSFFKDLTIDIQTGALLGRYIAEDRDSARMLAACHAELCRAADNGARAQANSGVSLAAVCAEIGELKACIAELQESVAALAGAPKGKKHNRLSEAAH